MAADGGLVRLEVRQPIFHSTPLSVCMADEAQPDTTQTGLFEILCDHAPGLFDSAPRNLWVYSAA